MVLQETTQAICELIQSTQSVDRSTFTVHVEPDVRANIAGTVLTVSTASGDNQFTIYDHTDLDSTNRALVRMTNTSQNADDYVYDWGDPKQ